MKTPFPVNWNCHLIKSEKFCLRKIEFKGYKYSWDYVEMDETCLLFKYFLLKRERDISLIQNGIIASFSGDHSEGKDAQDKAFEIIRNGLTISSEPGVVYRYFGHTNSNLRGKNGKQCLLIPADNDSVIYDILEEISGFHKINPIEKRLKRIALLFSKFPNSIQLESSDYGIIKDVQNRDYIFTDGCGMMSSKFCQRIQKDLKLEYLPSVVQLRFKGFKGTLVHTPELISKSVLFRSSMEKFKVNSNLADLNEFGIVKVSKPYYCGYLNSQIIMLLENLGVKESIILEKLESYLNILKDMHCNKELAIEYLECAGEFKNVDSIKQQNGIDEECKEDLVNFRQKDINLMKKIDFLDNLKCKSRILIKDSRFVFGVADPYGILEEGECFFNPTLLHVDQIESFSKCESVMVTRNPCYHSGDIRLLKLVRNDSFNHLNNCIVFSVKGARPEADKMGGGDLDGDEFFVTWDKSIFPDEKSSFPRDPYTYKLDDEKNEEQPPLSQDMNILIPRINYSNFILSIFLRSNEVGSVINRFPVKNRMINSEKDKIRNKMIESFANSNTKSLGELNNLFMKIAKQYGPDHEQCIKLIKPICLAVDNKPFNKSELDVIKRIKNEQKRIDYGRKNSKKPKKKVFELVQERSEDFLRNWFS